MNLVNLPGQKYIKIDFKNKLRTKNKLEIENTIIIEDNINNIFYYNRDNLICIKPFYGDISNEKNTLQLLGNILNKIRYDAEITGDISKSLHKEKYNIITEISTNLEE